MPLVRIEPVADAIGFLLIALVVMGLAGIVGKILAKTVHQLGLGCLDRLAGAAFGFLQGVLLVTLVHSGGCGLLSRRPTGWRRPGCPGCFSGPAI